MPARYDLRAPIIDKVSFGSDVSVRQPVVTPLIRS
jgi:hypothetical protein